ncbi:MAG: hypothetical protein DYG89_41405 [Caldilinea sp. CFX5]|nr:hypothetical protein [Caldilinea sp. CFX5]
MIVGHTLLADYTALWALVDECQALLGTPQTLLAMGEEATDSHLADWAGFPRKAWQRGRVFGPWGEVQWRSYNRQLRAVILVDRIAVNGKAITAVDGEQGEAIRTKLQALKIDTMVHAADQVVDEQLLLWRGAYATARIRRYIDAQGIDSFVRYCTATPMPTESK